MLADLDPVEYESLSKGYHHEQLAVRPPLGLVAPSFKPEIQCGHDAWVLDEANGALTRVHMRPRHFLVSKVRRIGLLI